MASNIAVYYRFDTDDVINDTLRNAITGTYDATIMPGTITTANYFIGKSALNIDESNSQFATMPASLTIPQSGFSIVFWIASNNIKTTNATIFEFANSTGAYGTGKYALSMVVNSSSQIVFRYYHNSGTPAGTLTSTISVNDNIWRHVVITFTSSNVVSLYINGKLNATATFSNYPFSTTYAVSYIGRNTVVSTIYFTGSIDDFRIYSYAITSEADINYLYYYPNYNIYTTSPSQTALLGNTVSNFYDTNNVNISQTYTPRTLAPGTVILVSGKPNQNFDTGDLTASSTTYVLPTYCIFDTVFRNLYVCDQGTGKLKRINMYSGVVNTIYTYTNVNSIVFDVSGINYYLTGQSYIPQIDISTNTFQQNINTNPLTNTVYGLTDNSNNIFISHATGIAKINLSGSLPTATSAVITTTIQMEQICFKPSSQVNIYAIDVSNTFIYVINKTTNANYKITLPASLFTNNPNTDLAGIVFDSMENLYVGGVNGNNNIYMIPYYVINAISTDTTLTADKIILYAGTSSFGYSGDGGQCINAQFMFIANLSIDAGNNLYIVDSGSSTIRKIINGGARKTNFMNLITNETSVVSKTASDLKTVYSGIYSIGSAGPSAMNYSNYCINNTSTTIETELQAATYNVVDNSGLLIYYKFNTMDTSGIQVANYSSGMPIFDASMSDVTMCSSNDSVVETGALTMSATSIGTWSSIGSLPRSSLLLPNNPSGFNRHGISFGSWNSVAVSQNGLYVAGVGDFHNFYTNYNTNYNIFSQLYTVPTVELVGGNGVSGYTGDGGIVTKAQFTTQLGNFVFTPDGYYISNFNTIRFVNNQSIIRTVCGTNTATTTGNFGLATAATCNGVYTVFQDLSKNYLYIAERSGNVIRRIDNKGIIYPFCGTGTASSTGDGGVAALATINTPNYFINDVSNNSYIIEDGGARIRIVDFSTNIISTLAGTGTAGFNDNVAASSAQFNRPLTAVLDASRNLYIADYNNNRIRKITAVNGVLSSSCTVTTICGTGTPTSTGDGRLATLATLNLPYGVSFNNDYSYLYISENGGRRIRAINMMSGIINTVAGTGVQTTTGNGGNPLLATIPSVFPITFDPSNNLYFGSGDNATVFVRRLTSLTSFPPFAKQPYDRVWALYGLSWKYISMSGTGQYQIAYMNNFGTYISNGYGSLNTWDYIADLSGIYTNSAALSYTGQYQSVMDVYGNIYVSSAYGANSTWTQKYVNTKNTNYTPMPAKIACSFDGKYQVATAFRHQQCVKIAGTGTLGKSGDGGLATAAQFNIDMRVRFDSSNNLIIGDGYNHLVRLINARTGIVTRIAGQIATNGFPAAGGTATAVNLQYTFGLLVDISNNYYVTSYHGLLKVTGTTLAILGGSGTAGFAGDGAVFSGTTAFSSPQKICCDSFNNIYICMGNNLTTANRVRKITASTNFVSTICGTGTASSTGDGGLATAATINTVSGICCDSFNNIYIGESVGNRVRKIDALSGIINTVCGTGTASTTGDGGQGYLATINAPLDLYMDRANNLYIAEYGNGTTTGNRVRKITARNGIIDGNCIITTYAGNGTQVTGGDNGLPTQLGLATCTSVSIDNYDNFYLYNNNAGILYKATQYANIIVSSNYGQTWTDVTTNITGNIAFNNVAVSQTGQYMTATALNGRIYRSTNYGALSSWTASNSSVDNWGSVVVSSTGQYQVAAGYDMSGVYSTDYGLNWTANGMPNGNWSSLALSESTNTLYAVSKNAGASGSTIYKNTAFNLPNSGLNSEWVTIHNPILKSASWPTVNGVSFSFWCKSNNNATWARFFDFGNGLAANNILMTVNSNNLWFAAYNGAVGNDQNTGIQINDNTWRHVSWTMTYDVSINSIYTIYINGVNSYQQSNQTFTIYPPATARQFCFIGKSNWAPDPSFNGVIDDFRIYNRVLSEREVFELYSASESIHYYKFDNDSDFTNTRLANYSTLKPIYDGTQYTQDPSPPILTTATTVSFDTYTILKPSVVNNIFGMAVTQNNKRILSIENNSTAFAFSDYNTNLKVWNAFTSVTITSLFWTGIKTSADGFICVMCACTTQGTDGGLYYSIWNGTTYSSVVTINPSPITTPRFYSGIELTANGNRLIAIADYVYFATWDADRVNFINLTATTLAVGSPFITYSTLLSKKDNMFGALACNADGSRIAYANSNNEIYFATWNGTTYVSPTLIAVLSPYVTGMTMSADGNLLFYSNVSDFSQKVYYSIWNGTAYTVQTELSYNLVVTANSSPNDGLPNFTPVGTLTMALSYDMSTLYIATNNNTATSDISAVAFTGYIYSLPLTYTNTSAMTKKVGTNSLVVQRQNTIVNNIIYRPTYDNSSTTASQPFTVGAIGASGISITSDGLRAVICGRSTGYLYVSVYTPISNRWGSLVAQTNQAAFTAGSLHRARITADGSRGIAATNIAGGSVYFYTWNTSTYSYSAFTATLGGTATTSYTDCDITSNGSRIFVVKDNVINYADWNGSNYGTWTSTGLTSLNTVSCNGDGTQIIYNKTLNNIHIATLTSGSYVEGSLVRSAGATVRGIKLSKSSKLYGYGSTGVAFYYWDGYSTYLTPTTGIVVGGSLVYYGHEITYDEKYYYVVSYVANAGTIYKINFNNSQVYIPYFTPTMTPFTIPAIQFVTISITEDGTRAVFFGNASGPLLYSTYNNTTGLWSALVSSPSVGGTVANGKLTADGSRCIAATDSSVYFSTWRPDLNNYSTWTQTLGGTTQSPCACALTNDGSRLFIVATGGIFYANWNGSNYSSWISTGIAGSANNTCYIGCSGDGMRIVYVINTALVLSWALWNGYTYIVQSTTFGVLTTQPRTIQLNYDGSLIFYSGTSNAVATARYCFWNGSEYSYPTSVPSTAIPLSINSSPLAISYDLKNIYCGNYTDNVLYKTVTDLKASTRVSALTIPDTKTLIKSPPLYTVTQPFSVPVGIYGFSITQDGTRAVTIDSTTVYLSTYNGSTWSTMTATNATTTGTTFINVKLTADGSRGVTISRAGTGFAYFFTWTGSTYSTFTQTLGATSTTYQAIDMTSDGSRIFTVDAAFVKYADWNGSNYSTWTNTSFAGSGIQTAAVGCSSDGNKIVYCCNTSTLNYALWNGSSYVLQSTFGAVTVGASIRCIRFSYDGRYVFGSHGTSLPNLFYSAWNGTTFGDSNYITVTGMTFTDSYPLAVSYSTPTTVYIGIFRLSTSNLMYEVTGITMQPFTAPTSLLGISITQDGLRAVVNSDTAIYVSTYSNSVWSNLTATSATAPSAFLINVKITADGSRGVTVSRGFTNTAYFFTWTGSTYSSLTTFGATSISYSQIDMTTDGSRVFTVDATFVKYSDWNGTTYSAWTNTTIVGSAVGTAAIGCSADGYRIVYCCNTATLGYAAWNGSSYVPLSTFGTVSAGSLNTIRFSYDGNYVFYSRTTIPNVQYSIWTGTTFGNTNSIYLTGIQATNAFPLAISYDFTTVYSGGYSTVYTNALYQVPLTLQTIAPNTTGISFSYWVKSIASPDYGGLISLQSIYGWILMYMIGNNVYAAINEQKATLPASIYPTSVTKNSVNVATITQYTWTHIAWTIQQINTNYDVSGAGIWTVYVNGNSVYRNTNQIYPYPGTRTTNFVGYNGQSNVLMNGNLDDYRAYNRVLSAKDIQNIYVNSPNITYEKTANIPAGLQSEIGGTYTFSSGNAIPTLVNYMTIYRDVSAIPIQNGAYVLSNSTNLSTLYWYNAFDNNSTTFSHTAQTYNTTTGVYTGTITTHIQGVGNVSGEWQQIQVPYLLQVSSYIITNRASFEMRFPGTWYLVGSNDGTNWYPVDYNTGYVYVQDTVTFTPNQSNTNYYSYFRFVWIVVGGTPYTTTRTAINLTAVQFSGAARYLNYYYFLNSVKTYIPRLQSDNFSTWRLAIDNTTRNWNNAAISNEGTILATVQTQATVYRSIDYGLTWALYGTSTTSARQVAIASNGTNATIADFASTFLRYSTNGGTTWTAAVTTSKWKLVAMNSAGSKTTFGTDGSGNFYSTAIGQTVVASSGGLTSTNNGISMSSSGTYCLTTYNTTTTIYRSASSGAAYAASSSASAIWSSCAIEDTGLAFAFTTAGQLYRSTDFGVNWSTVASHPVEGASSVSISTSGQYILTTTPYNIYFSNDYGVTFSLKSRIPFTSATTPQISISRDGRIAAATTTNGKLFIARL